MRFEQQPKTVVCQWLKRAVSCIEDDELLLDVKHTKYTGRGSALLLVRHSVRQRGVRCGAVTEEIR